MIKKSLKPTLFGIVLTNFGRTFPTTVNREEVMTGKEVNKSIAFLV